MNICVQATRLWLALAAFVIFLFVCFSSSLFSRGPPAELLQPEDVSGISAAAYDPSLAAKREIYNRGSPVAAPAASAAAANNLHSLTHRGHHPHRHASDPASEVYAHPDDQDRNEMQEHPEEETEEEEEIQHDAETHPEFDSFEDTKQHPDEPDFVDIWVINTKRNISIAFFAIMHAA